MFEEALLPAKMIGGNVEVELNLDIALRNEEESFEIA